MKSREHPPTYKQKLLFILFNKILKSVLLSSPHTISKFLISVRVRHIHICAEGCTPAHTVSRKECTARATYYCLHESRLRPVLRITRGSNLYCIAKEFCFAGSSFLMDLSQYLFESSSYILEINTTR